MVFQLLENALVSQTFTIPGKTLHQFLTQPQPPPLHAERNYLFFCTEQRENHQYF